MRTNRTANSVAEAGKLCIEAKGLSQDKAVIVAMVTEAFVNGMNAQQRLTTDPAPRPESRN